MDSSRLKWDNEIIQYGRKIEKMKSNVYLIKLGFVREQIFREVENRRSTSIFHQKHSFSSGF